MSDIKTIGFPFDSSQGFPATMTNEDAIKASLIQIITTGFGERVMRPDFGCGAMAYVFENDSDEYRRMVERDIRGAIAKWEQRVLVQSVIIEPGDEVTAPGQVIITIAYNILATQQNDTVSIAM